MILSVNFNYGEHEMNRIKRYKKIHTRLNSEGIKIFNFVTLSYTFEIKQNEIPKTISRLVHEVIQYCPICEEPMTGGECKTHFPL
jgi:hypothetical protein